MFLRCLIILATLSTFGILFGCQSSEVYEQAFREDLDARYPIGCQRETIHRSNGSPVKCCSIQQGVAEEEDIQAVLSQLDAEVRRQAHECDLYWVYWAVPGHSSLSARSYYDCVFYDSDLKVIESVRHFLD